ncbi:ABC-type glutathione transport system ATPase component [Rhizobium sp. SG_E_25_P2]|uniref:ABC transporter ATP-binding protein n=1 Tax=Rhizobium sp. SG_E_25_P2 TaxID=2879942 RepID=UPI0024731622|nr:ATP-binding cassette domain-containing protein [Rhizobium sp. SG_E_25_P2]MDH6266361.1 ABC-type glutathione transport system ATPase component [Rhizobium sp. SG_E_25_P2]
MTLLVAENIMVHAGSEALVNPVSLSLSAGRAVTILGESGSGKSLLAQAIIGTLPKGLTASGSIAFGKDRVEPVISGGMRARWGRRVAVLPQEPWLALDPLMPARRQVAEVYAFFGNDPHPGDRANADLAALGLEGAGSKYPWQLSGGMAQRLAFAAARAGGATVTVADEPTKGLDVGRRDDVLALLRRGLEGGGGLLTITHDLALAAGLGGEILVMKGGEVIERGPAEHVLASPEHAYTQALIASDPACWPRRAPTAELPPLLRADGLQVERDGKLLFAPVSFALSPGKVLGVFGPSGCGKSSLGNAILGLLPHRGALWRDPAGRRLGFQKLWQDPPAAFPARITLAQGLEDLVRLHGIDRARLSPLLEKLKLSSDLLNRLPSEISGGELQRIALMRALLLDPVFLFADEPTSRLDPVTQAETMQLLLKVAAEQGLAIMVVSHDEALLSAVSDDVIRLNAP